MLRLSSIGTNSMGLESCHLAEGWELHLYLSLNRAWNFLSAALIVRLEIQRHLITGLIFSFWKSLYQRSCARYIVGIPWLQEPRDPLIETPGPVIRQVLVINIGNWGLRAFLYRVVYWMIRALILLAGIVGSPERFGR